MTTNATLTGGLALKAGTTTSYSPTGTAGTLGIRWNPFYSASSGSSSGNIQTSDATLPVTVSGSGSTGDTTFNVNDANKGYFLEIPNVSVPFKITMYYSNTGSNPKRYPIVYANGAHIKTFASTNSTTAVNDNHSFYGTGETTTTVQLACSGGMRFFDVIIEKIDPLPTGLSISAAGSRTWVWSDATDVPAANKSLAFTAMVDGVADSTVTWSAKTTNDAEGADATGVDITGGVLTATNSLTATTKVWVFATKDAQVSEGYEVTVKKIAKVYNFATSGSTYFAGAQTFTDGQKLGGDVTIIATTSMTSNAQNNGSMDGFSFTNRIQYGGGSLSGTTIQRAVQFPITGQPNIIMYLNPNGTNRVLALSEDLIHTAAPNVGVNGTNGDVILTTTDWVNGAIKYEFKYTGSASSLYIYTSSQTFTALLCIVLETVE